METERLNALKSLFFHFLKKNDAFIAYKTNFSLPYSTRTRKASFYPSDIKGFIKTCDPSSYVAYAFVWDRSPQGERFWCVLNRKWKITYLAFDRGISIQPIDNENIKNIWDTRCFWSENDVFGKKFFKKKKKVYLASDDYITNISVTRKNCYLYLDSMPEFPYLVVLK